MNKKHTDPATIAEILLKHPCPQCGTVEIIDDDVPGATCDCGRCEGTQTRWEIDDIWSLMSEADKQSVEQPES